MDKQYVAYPSVEIYMCVQEWLDALITAGNLTEDKKRPVERGDIGFLNQKIQQLIVKRNFDCEVKSV